MKTSGSVIGLVLLASMVGCGGGSEGGRDDYLSPELRARVEQLKTEVAAEPSTPDNVFERGEVLWQWANAYSLTGRPLPVNLTMYLAILRSVEHHDGFEFLPPGVKISWKQILPTIDALVRELHVKDEDPHAVGTLSLASSEPLVSQSWATIELSYEVGSMPMVSDGGLLLGRQLMSDLGGAQHEDPAADNYVSVRCSNPDAVFEPSFVPLSGMHGGFKGVRQMPAFKLQGATLQPGDVITVTYGDRSGGSRGLFVQSFSTDSLIFPLYVDLEGGGNFFTPVWPSIEVLGSAAVRAAVFAPSIVAVNESFEISVRTEDRFWNRASSAIPEYKVLLDGKPVRGLPANGPAVQVVSDLLVDEPGVYRFQLRSADGAISATSNPVWVHPDPQRRVFWGETHGHTAYAEGQGTPESFFDYAREDARLDFVSLSEHGIWIDANEWRTMQELTRRSTEQGVVAFLGYEWTAFRTVGGHHNVFFRTADKDLVSLRDASDLESLYERLRQNNEVEDVLIIPHAHRAGDWTTNDSELEKLAEIYSMHGSFEWFGNRYLGNGFEVGFVAGSDDHRSKPGYAPGRFQPALSQFGGLAGAVAPSKDVDAIFDALRDRAVYATSGQRIILDATLNGARMGSRLTDTGRRNIECRVMGTSPIDRIDVIKNGEVVYGQDYLSAPLEPRSWIQVTFESSSEVLGEEVDNPRPYRLWQGTMEVVGSRVLGVAPAGFDNPFSEWARVDEVNPRKIAFRTETRGRGDSMLVELDGASTSTELVIHLDAARERGFAPGLRPAADIPAVTVKISLADLSHGRVERELAVGPHTDTVRVQVVDPGASMDREFSYTDLEPAEPGDYYYIRVTQLDGGRAWSSPWWVGE
jgi:hypothetical protein